MRSSSDIPQEYRSLYSERQYGHPTQHVTRTAGKIQAEAVNPERLANSTGPLSLERMRLVTHPCESSPLNLHARAVTQTHHRFPRSLVNLRPG